MIQSKKKKCKGTSKAIGYGCGEKLFIHKYGLCKKCFQEWLFSNDGHETLIKSIITGKNKAKVKAKKDFQKKKIESKSIAKLIQEARAPFQKLIRIRDHGKNCICCDRPLPFDIGEYDGGHLYPANSYTGLIFHPHNVNGQLVGCNKYEYGNQEGYIEGLKQRIGIESFKELEASKNTLKTYKWDRYKLIEMKEYYNKELRLVEKGLKDISEVDFSIGIVCI